MDSQTGQAIYETNATAQVKFTLTPDMQGQIRDLVKGQDVAKAIQLINQTYGGYINAGPIQAKVLWFDIGKLPTDPAHIVVQLGSDTPIGSVAQPDAKAGKRTANSAVMNETKDEGRKTKDDRACSYVYFGDNLAVLRGCRMGLAD